MQKSVNLNYEPASEPLANLEGFMSECEARTHARAGFLCLQSCWGLYLHYSSLLLSSLELRDTTVCEP